MTTKPKHTRRRGLTAVSRTDALNITQIYDLDKTFPAGLKVRLCRDRDPWYIVGWHFDKSRGSDCCIVILKSWNKYRKEWIYFTENAFNALAEFALIGELYMDRDGNYVVKENKISSYNIEIE